MGIHTKLATTTTANGIVYFYIILSKMGWMDSSFWAHRSLRQEAESGLALADDVAESNSAGYTAYQTPTRRVK